MNALNKIKIAIVCDWLVAIGGAEKFLGHLLQCFPNADLFAVVDFIDKEKCGFLKEKPIKTTFIQKLPFAKTHYRGYLPLMPLAIEQLDVSAYDLIISSSHAVAKGVITGPNQIHISYIHSPMRYAWDLQHQYLRETGLDKKFKGWLARYFLHKLRLWDLRSANGVDYFVANSQFIAKRIEKTYRRPVDVIYPPIEAQRFAPLSSSQPKQDFYLTASRLVPYKRIDLIVESFNRMPDKKLIVIGDGPDYGKIKAKAGANVSILGYQPNDVLISHLQRAKAFVFAAEEDFGLLPVEAQACGTPVIAYGKGGALETVRGLTVNTAQNPAASDSNTHSTFTCSNFTDANVTGIFFSEQTPAAICEAVQQFESTITDFTPENCTANAARFSPTQFQENFKKFVSEKLSLASGHAILTR